MLPVRITTSALLDAPSLSLSRSVDCYLDLSEFVKGYCTTCYKTLFDVLHDVFVLFTTQQNTRATCEPCEMCTDV